MGNAGDKVYQKLKLLSGYMNELTPLLRDISQRQYEEDALRRHAAERLAELIIEAAIDINGELILAANQPPPDDYYSSFIALSKLGVCDRTRAERLAPMAGFRNRLAHEYEAVDDVKAYETIAALPELFRDYVQWVTRYLERTRPS